MNRNTESHYGNIPKIHQNRSKFDLSHSVKTTFSNGDIIPVDVQEVLPGDTVQMDMSQIIRMATPIYPVMDNMMMDVYFFFTPARLLWNHWTNMWGENDDPWIQQTEYETPRIKAPTGGWEKGTIADYMGIPTYVEDIEANALPFRGYVKIWNDWFRDENLKNAAHMYDDDTTRTGSNMGDYVLNAELGAKPLKAAKLADIYTKCLPSPQRGPSVNIPLGGYAPVRTVNKEISIGSELNPPLQMGMLNGNEPVVLTGGINYNIGVSGTYGNLEYAGNNTPETQTHINVFPLNLAADLGNATAATINQLRTAFAIQKFFEAAGRFGNGRYIEFLRGVFGVESSDARLQRAEYLGGTRVPVNMESIVQTSATNEVSPQGNASGYSVTINKENMFTKSFEEHGFLYCLVVTRVEHTYQQGLHKMWSRKKWTDYYNPYFAHLSESPIYRRELMATGTETDEEVFGYNEAWAEYRSLPNRVTGAFRSNNPNGSLDAWHYADDYETPPYLSSAWIDEPKENVDRTIAVSSELEDQFIADFYFKEYVTRCMPVYSVPGLIDHV